MGTSKIIYRMSHFPNGLRRRRWRRERGPAGPRRPGQEGNGKARLGRGQSPGTARHGLARHGRGARRPPRLLPASRCRPGRPGRCFPPLTGSPPGTARLGTARHGTGRPVEVKVPETGRPQRRCRACSERPGYGRRAAAAKPGGSLWSSYRGLPRKHTAGEDSLISLKSTPTCYVRVGG